MSDFVQYSRELMEAAKGFRNAGARCEEGSVRQAYFRASILHSFSFLESHLNYVADHFRDDKMFSLHERGILLEREISFESGRFRLKERPKFFRMTDRIDLIIEKCSKDAVKSKQEWYPKLKEAIIRRNALVHPTDAHVISDEQLCETLSSVMKCVSALYICVFKKDLPYAAKGLEGGLDF